MTYRLDSDILWLYGKIVDLETNKIIEPSVNVNWEDPDETFNDAELVKIATNKTKTAAWIVSNCNAPSKRDNFTHKLQEFIDIEIYGECGTVLCPPDVDCVDMIAKTYRFYLAFENSLCTDYITEKVYKVMTSFIIPVIFSGAQISKFLPKKSFIDANAFKTAEELANFLKQLSQNPIEYVKYFWWRKKYKITERTGIFNPCKVCQKLSEPNLWSKQQVYLNLGDWYKKDICVDPTIKF